MSSSLRLFKVKRYSRGYYHISDTDAKLRLKDQNIYETVQHMLARLYHGARYYKYEVFAAKPFINSNDELEIAWELLTEKQLEVIRQEYEAERLDKKAKRR